MSDSLIQSPEFLNNPTGKELCPVAGNKQANRQLHLLPSSLLGCEAPIGSLEWSWVPKPTQTWGTRCLTDSIGKEQRWDQTIF